MNTCFVVHGPHSRAISPEARQSFTMRRLAFWERRVETGSLKWASMTYGP
jgi:hypothetical protein